MFEEIQYRADGVYVRTTPDGEWRKDEQKTASLRDHAYDLYLALTDGVALLKDYLEDIGGCDHSVGICCCQDYSRLECMETALRKASGEKIEVAA